MQNVNGIVIFSVELEFYSRWWLREKAGTSHQIGWTKMFHRQFVLASRIVDDFFADNYAFLFFSPQLLNVISSENYKTVFSGRSTGGFFCVCGPNLPEVTRSICGTGTLSPLILCFFM